MGVAICFDDEIMVSAAEMAELPASEWASATAVSETGCRSWSTAHSDSSVTSRRDNSSASFR